MKFTASVYEPMYEYNDKKYIRLFISDNHKEIIKRMHSNKCHLLTNNIIDNIMKFDYQNKEIRRILI